MSERVHRFSYTESDRLEWGHIVTTRRWEYNTDGLDPATQARLAKILELLDGDGLIANVRMDVKDWVGWQGPHSVGPGKLIAQREDGKYLWLMRNDFSQ